jgi:hypothetical protein
MLCDNGFVFIGARRGFGFEGALALELLDL